MYAMFGIGPWELIFVLGCFGVVFVIAAVTAVVIIAGQKKRGGDNKP